MITNYYNPLNAIPINLTDSQEDKEDSKIGGDGANDMDYKHAASGQDSLDVFDPPEVRPEPSPHSPLKAFANLATRALDFFTDSSGSTPYPSPSLAAEGKGSNN